MDERAEAIVRMFAQGRSAKEVAKVLGYGNHESVGQYMRRRGYRWDPRLRNYTKDGQGAGCAEGSDPLAEPLPEAVAEEAGSGPDSEAVKELLRRAPEVLALLGRVPPRAPKLGIRPRQRSRPEISKGFRISVELNQRLEQFCAEHGVMQKDVLETALWEFLESRADV